MSTALSEITRFQTERKLDEKAYDWSVEATNIVEELLEAIGINDRNTALLVVGDMQLRINERVQQGLVIAPSEFNQLDAFGDIIVFACGAITKLGYNPELILTQVALEINSRKGTIIDGKFVKDKSPEAKAEWVRADFTKCKLIKVTHKQRDAFHRTEGFMGDDAEVAKWVMSLI